MGTITGHNQLREEILPDSYTEITGYLVLVERIAMNFMKDLPHEEKALLLPLKV